jgi:hypothetical protein
LNLNTKNFKDKKLKGAIKRIGSSLAILGSIPVEINPFRSKVPIDQKKTRFIRYLTPDFE